MSFLLPGLESGVFSGRAFTIVVVTNDNPWDASGFVLSGNVWDTTSFASSPVADVVHLFVLRVETSDEEVVGDVVQVATELQPWTGGGDVVSGALALDLDEDPHVGKVSADPLVEGGEELQSVGGGRHVNSNGAAILRGSLKTNKDVHI